MVFCHKLRKIPFAALFIFLLIFTIVLHPQTASASEITETEMCTISGTVYLPEGDTAPAGGVRGSFVIQGEAGSASNPTDDYLDLVHWSIPEGESSITYSIEIPGNLTEGVRISCSPFPMHGYVGGYYSVEGMTRDYSSASLIAANGVSAEGIDFILEKGVIISGTISLPEGDTVLYSNLPIMIRAISDNGTPENIADDKRFSVAAVIGPGGSSTSYSLAVPGDMSGNIIISYEVFPGNNYVPGYYSASGTVWSANAATPLDISGGSISGIDMTIIKGKPVTGTITLPEGETAPAGGIGVYLDLEGDNGTGDNPLDDYTTYDLFYWRIFASIPEGENSSPYTAYIPNELTGSIKIRYSVNSSTGYTAGYYRSNGAVWSAADADLVALDEYGASDVNIIMLKGRWISGSVSLPEGHVVSGGDMYFNVLVMSDNLAQGNGNDIFLNGQQVCIKEGESTGTFSILVPDNCSFGFIVSCLLGGDSSYIGGCYNENGMLTDRESATRIYVAGSDIAGINLVFLERTSEQNHYLVMSNNLQSNVAAGTLVQAGKEIVITVSSEGIENLKGFDLRFSYDPALFELQEVKAHEEFGVEDDNVYLEYIDKDGNVRVVGAILGSGDRSGDTGLVNITLKAKTMVDGKTSAVVKAQSQISDSFEKLYTFGNDIFSSLVVADPDVDGDDQIGESDLEKIAESFMRKDGQEGYIAKRDMDKDNIVDLFDIVYVAKVLLNNDN